MVRKVLIGAVVLMGLMASPAAAQYDFNVTPGEIVPGGEVTVSGRCDLSNGEAQITFEGNVVATAATDVSGNFSGSFIVPMGTSLGTYEVGVVCGDSVASVKNLTVVSGDVVTPPGRGGAGELDRTGSDVNTLGLIGGGLLVAGGAVLFATRKRQTA